MQRPAAHSTPRTLRCDNNAALQRCCCSQWPAQQQRRRCAAVVVVTAGGGRGGAVVCRAAGRPPPPSRRRQQQQQQRQQDDVVAAAAASAPAPLTPTSPPQAQPPPPPPPPQQQQQPDWSAGLLKLTKRQRRNRPSSGGALTQEQQLRLLQERSALEAAYGGGGEEEDEGEGQQPHQQQQAPAAGRMLDDDEAWEGATDWDSDDDEDGSSSGSGSGSAAAGERKRLPASVRCFDTARVYVKSGDGGAGCVSFRREPYVEKGGPNGGNGGRGGHVWAVADKGLSSLSSFRQRVHFRASQGSPGQGSFRDGSDGSDLRVRVPVGTIIRRRDAAEGEPPLAELLRDGQEALLAVGGRGGRGNASFKTRLNTAPTIAERGEAGGEEWLDLELKVVADVGIVGVPNAGKSTLLGVLSAARPKVADYPFTTLVPNLGVCEMDYQTTVFADVPGLLEGAHEGHGLGHAFLRHVSRCRVLVHLLDGTSPDPIGDYKAVQLELELFNPALLAKPQVVAYNKVDQPDSGDYWGLVREYLVDEEGVDAARVLPVSALTGRGVRELVAAVRGVLAEHDAKMALTGGGGGSGGEGAAGAGGEGGGDWGLGAAPLLVPETNALNRTKVPRRFKPEARIDAFIVERPDPGVTLPGGARVFVVRGAAVERFAQMTNWDYYEAVKRFQRVLEVSGINAALLAAGVRAGDTVALGDDVGEFVWSDDRGEGAAYGAWLEDMAARGRPRQGGSKWPTPR